MADAGVAATTDFDWASQMRFYWRGDNETGHLKVRRFLGFHPNTIVYYSRVQPLLQIPTMMGR